MCNIIIEDKVLGPAAPDLGWVPAPRYLLRRSRIKRALENLTPSSLLEVGCGPGMLLHELTASGFQCVGLETSDKAHRLAVQLARIADKNIDFHTEPQEDWAERFPLIMAFEVLEHIEKDEVALTTWHQWLEPGGTLLLSVPAHMRSWNASDVWAGHFRRYERSQLVSLMRRVGFNADSIECYGFPLANALEAIRARRHAASKRVLNSVSDSLRGDNTAKSGIDRSLEVKWFPLLRSWPGKAVMRIAMALQVPFTSTELGNGYLLRATKRS